MTLDALKTLNSFIVWKSESDASGRMTKVPYSAKDGRKVGISPEYSQRWSTYADAKQALVSGGYNGLGFIFTKITDKLSVCGIDIDHADPDSETAKEIIAMFPKAYVERSPSGNGLHLVLLADIARIPVQQIDEKLKLDTKYYSKNPNNGVETYIAGLTNRYFTFTENVIQNGQYVEQTDEFLRFLERYMLREERPTPKQQISSVTNQPDAKYQSAIEHQAAITGTAVITDSEILQKARKAANRAKFTALFDNGDITGYDSPSNADAALCALLAFHSGGDAETIDRLFRQSKLYRAKWERADYRDSTIRNAVNLYGAKINGTHIANMPEFVVYDHKNQCERVVPTLLTRHFRKNQNYIFVKDGGRGGVNRFVYRDGYYQLFDDEPFKGVIKSYVTAYDETLVRMRDIGEVFANLCTDLDFVSYEDINIDEGIINFQNGLLRLSDMTLLPHSPNVMSTIQIPCVWTGRPTPTPIFDKYLATLANNDKAIGMLLLEFIGAALSNVKGWRMKKSLFLVGPGDTGKSQLKSLVERLLGRSNFVGIDLGELEARFGTSNLYNKRLAGSSDMSFITVKELKAFKKCTGGDSLFAEFKGKDGFEFIYNGLLWFCMNRLPKFGGDDGQWVYDRIMHVECPNTIPLAQQDKQLLDKLYAEREGIVYKAVLALLQVIANGYRFSEPKSVIHARAAYQAENNSVIAFWIECMTQRQNKADSCTVSQVYDVYKAWCRDNNHGFAKSAREFRSEVCAMLGARTFDDITTRWSAGKLYRDFTLTAEAKLTYASSFDYVNNIPPQAVSTQNTPQQIVRI